MSNQAHPQGKGYPVQELGRIFPVIAVEPEHGQGAPKNQQALVFDKAPVGHEKPIERDNTGGDEPHRVAASHSPAQKINSGDKEKGSQGKGGPRNPFGEPAIEVPERRR